MFSPGTNNHKGLRQTHLVYYFIIIRVATCFDPIGSSSGLHYEPVNYRAAYIVRSSIVNWTAYLAVNWFSFTAYLAVNWFSFTAYLAVNWFSFTAYLAVNWFSFTAYRAVNIFYRKQSDWYWLLLVVTNCHRLISTLLCVIHSITHTAPIILVLSALDSSIIFPLWRRKYYMFPKNWYLPTEIHGLLY